MMNIDGVRIKLMEKATFLSWPMWTGGNALARIISAHQEDYWWHPWFNLWDYDEKITCPLQYPETQDFQEILNGQFWTTAHIATALPQLSKTLGSFAWKTDEEINKAILDFFNDQSSNATVNSFLEDVVKGNKKFIWPVGHTSATATLKQYPHIQQVVELDNSTKVASARIGASTEYLNIFKEFERNKNFDNKKILYLDTDKFFGNDFSEYETEFDKLSNFLNFTYPRKKAVRAYLLYYNDRKRTYGHMDQQTEKLKDLREKVKKRENERIF
tara:strand:+ start:502 stop:1317 length:816 start_codon:yes stop_codon:yes gene_type:complete